MIDRAEDEISIVRRLDFRVPFVLIGARLRRRANEPRSQLPPFRFSLPVLPSEIENFSLQKLFARFFALPFPRAPLAG